MNQIIGLTSYVVLPYVVWVLITGFLFNKIKNLLIYNFIVHCLYISSVLFIGVNKAGSVFLIEALIAVVTGLSLLAYYSRSDKSFIKTILTPIPYLIFLATYVLTISW